MGEAQVNKHIINKILTYVMLIYPLGCKEKAVKCVGKNFSIFG